MKACRNARAAIRRSFAEPLSLNESFLLEEHARECDACRRELESNEQLAEALLNMPAPPIERLDLDRSIAAIHAGIAEAEITGASASPPRVARRTRYVTWRSAAAAALVLAVALIALRPGPSNAPDVAQPESTAVAVAEPQPAAPVEDVAPAAAPEREPAPPFVHASTSAEFSRERLASARREVRAFLEKASAALVAYPDAAERFADRFEFLAAPLLENNWPIKRICEGLVSGPEPVPARSAARYLGVRGNERSMRALVDALQYDDRKDAALLALIDAGELGLEGLARAVWDPELGSRVLEEARELDPDRGAQWVARAIRYMPRRSAPEASPIGRELVALLADHEHLGATLLVELARRKEFDQTSLIEALARNEAGAGALERSLVDDPSVSEIPFLLAAVERLHPSESLAWVADRARSRRVAGEALRVLATFDGVEALLLLLDPRVNARASASEELRAWRTAIDRDHERFVTLALRLVDDEWSEPDIDRRFVARRFLDALIESERAEAADAILVLAGGELLRDQDRERALLAVGDIGDERHHHLLRELFLRLGPKDRDLAAACLSSAYAIQGEQAARDLLSELPPTRKDRLISLLSQPKPRGGTAALRFRLAQVLEPYLASGSEDPWGVLQ